jgi:hypothetical protein
MAKIVIIAPADTDVDDAVKLLKNNGNEVDVQEPSPKAMLHIVLGLLSPTAYGFGSNYAYAPGGIGGGTDNDAGFNDVDGKDADDAGKDDGADDTSDEPSDADEPGGSKDDDFSFEGMTAVVDGEQVHAVRVKAATSKLIVESLEAGPRAVYTINESKFAFWPADVNAPATRVRVESGAHSSVLEIQIQKGDKTILEVGDDLAGIFSSK